ncbi:hypothetical protein B296_00019511 [Ensete ventricosum]|uniref:Uncharacterized protein n=1 Tax=Ensete ventricosum TaxID=4639 RepID=A0A426ZRX6_ENSVE|nr:hypothetical protein B296_00019511 [Ensete ventricosum]
MRPSDIDERLRCERDGRTGSSGIGADPNSSDTRLLVHVSSNTRFVKILIHGVKWGPRRAEEEKIPFPPSSSVLKLGRVSEEGGEEAFSEHATGPRSRRAPTRYRLSSPSLCLYASRDRVFSICLVVVFSAGCSCAY